MSSRHAAIVLAAGSGTRMHSDIPKQYLDLRGKPVLYYSLKALEESFVDDIVLVTGVGWQEYCQNEIVKKYGLKKVRSIVPGGAQRYDSVYRGLRETEGADYIYIHDGARPFLTVQILENARETAAAFGSAIAGMPVKDTIKIADENQYVKETPLRSSVWQVQTPQAFRRELVVSAYQKLFETGSFQGITDDAMVVEQMLEMPVKLFEASYENIKITTPEDLKVAEILMDDPAYGA